jgi:uncharacterized protein (DUF1778 family)
MAIIPEHLRSDVPSPVSEKNLRWPRLGALPAQSATITFTSSGSLGFINSILVGLSSTTKIRQIEFMGIVPCRTDNGAILTQKFKKYCHFGASVLFVSLKKLHHDRQGDIHIMRDAQGNQRVSARVPSKVYDALAQAAGLTGSTLNQFIVQSAYAKAQEVIEKERFIKMTARSASVFFDTLEKPPAPNKKLRSAVRSFKKKRDVSQN